jgi:hypothetical protein
MSGRARWKTQGLPNKFWDSFLFHARQSGSAVTWNIRWCNKTDLTWKVWISCVQYSLNSSSLDYCASSTLSRHENGAYSGTESECENCVKLQKSPTGQMPVHIVEIEELPQATKATDVKFQDKNNVNLLFLTSGISSTLNLYLNGPLLIRHST